jgi:acetolactate synthase I/II/III large subunit
LHRFNDGSISWIKALHMLHNAAQYLSVDFTRVDASRRRTFGLQPWRVSTSSQPGVQLGTAFAHVQTVLIDVVVESVVDEPPPVNSQAMAMVKASRLPV